jgi:hypothetical protein
MARGTQVSNKTFFKISYEKNAQGAIDKDSGKPFFAEQRKEGDNWISVSEDTFLEGHIIGIKKDSYDYKNKPQYTFELVINGGEENYVLQMNYGYFTRNILNSLATIEDFQATKLRLEIWRNKEGFVTVGVKNSTHDPKGERTEWLLKQNTLPKSDDPKWLASFDYFINMISQRLEDQTGVPTSNTGVQMDGDPDEMTKGLDEIAERNAENPIPNDSDKPEPLPF